MKSSLSTSYVVPAVLLNPVLFLHSCNALLARILPPIAIDAPAQHSPYTTWGPSSHPHLDIHANERLCMSYTLVMVCAQLFAFGRVSLKREEMKERARKRKERPPGPRRQSSKDVSLQKPLKPEMSCKTVDEEPAKVLHSNGTVTKTFTPTDLSEDSAGNQTDSSDPSDIGTIR